MSTKPRIAIIGLGRIGASLGLALKKANPELEIVGHDKDSKAAQAAQKSGAVDRTNWNLINACDGAALIVLAMPPAGVKEALDALKTELEPGAVVTDTSSSKVAVLKWAEALPKEVSFIGGHPIIPPSVEPQRDSSGADLPDAALFRGAVYCLVPSATASQQAVELMTSFVSLIGAKPLFLDAYELDGLVTGAEHLPYLLAAALLRSTTASSGWRDMERVAGRRYLEATALAARDPERQRDLVLHHREDLTRWIDVVIDTLKDIRGALQRGDAEHLDTLFGEMIDARAAWLQGQSGMESEVDPSEYKPTLSHMLLGGLANRERKRK